MMKLLRRFSIWVERFGGRLRDRYDLCEICREKSGDAECPCGKRVCDECQDYGIYTDEVCCTECATDLRKGWKDCSGHEFDEPYENDDCILIEQCKNCGYAHVIEVAP